MPHHYFDENHGQPPNAERALKADSSPIVATPRVNGFHPTPNGAAQPNGIHKRPRTAYMGSDNEQEDDRGDSHLPSPKRRKVTNGIKPVNGTDPSRQEEMRRHREQLPIWTGRDALVAAVNRNDTVVILGETGSGKTTQVPQFLHEAGFSKKGVIGVTQPRRVAATSLATRVAQEQSKPLGDLVGYSVRFDERSSLATRIKYATDGMMVRELLLDRQLSKYSVIILDEAHERTLRNDLLLGSLKRIQRERNSTTTQKGANGTTRAGPLKVIVMSATLDAERFSKFFDNCPILYIKGRQFPVKIHHTKDPQPDFNDAALKTFFQIHLSYPPGDVLAFLPGQDDIESLERSIRAHAAQLPADKPKVLVLPLYAALPQEQQRRIFNAAPQGSRKCILATNIAETSITIPGIKYVIDTGLCKEKIYHSKNGGSGIDELRIAAISKSSAMQRAGRAGREGEGYCFRLYVESAYSDLHAASIPEIQRCDFDSACLTLKCHGEDPRTFDFMDPPADGSVAASLSTLWSIHALDKYGNVTPLGRRLAAYPLDPSLARVLLASKDRACVSEIIDIISLMTATAKLYVDSADVREAAAEARKKFQHRDGDHMTLLNVFRSYEDVSKAGNKKASREWCRTHYLNEKALLEAASIRTQLRENCERDGIDWKVSCGDNPDPVLRCLVDGYVRKCALKQPDNTYRQTGSQSTIKIHPSSSMVDRKPHAIVFDELVRIS